MVTRGDPAISSAFNLEDVRADRTPVLHDSQDVSYHLSKYEGGGAISDASTNSAVEGTRAVRTKEEASATEDSAITEGDLEECSEQDLRDDQPIIDDRAKFEVIRPSIVGEVSSAMSTLTTISAGINHVVTANSALEDPAVRNDLGLSQRAIRLPTTRVKGVDAWIPVLPSQQSQRDVEANSEGLSWTVKTSNHGDEGEPRAKCGVDELSSADVVNSAMVGGGGLDVSGSKRGESFGRATACRQDVSYTGEEFALREVSSAVSVNSSNQHYDATEYYDSRKVLLHEGIKPNDDPATADSALETMEAETGLNVARRHDDDTIYLGDKFEHAEVRSTTVVDSADTGPHVDDSYNLSEVLQSRGTETEIGVTSSATTVFDPGGIGYNPTETLRQHFLAVAATEDEQEEDVDDSKTDIFERNGTDL
ncbi:hypothetical protein PInf_009782 [Phytophthora infestans]|nr:hypothetical protein PInf_009782 [Phytophthora infestans]